MGKSLVECERVRLGRRAKTLKSTTTSKHRIRIASQPLHCALLKGTNFADVQKIGFRTGPNLRLPIRHWTILSRMPQRRCSWHGTTNHSHSIAIGKPQYHTQQGIACHDILLKHRTTSHKGNEHCAATPTYTNLYDVQLAELKLLTT